MLKRWLMAGVALATLIGCGSEGAPDETTPTLAATTPKATTTPATTTTISAIDWFNDSRARDDYQHLAAVIDDIGDAAFVQLNLVRSSCDDLRVAVESLRLDLPTPDEDLNSQVTAALDRIEGDVGPCDKWAEAISEGRSTGEFEPGAADTARSFGADMNLGLGDLADALQGYGIPVG